MTSPVRQLLKAARYGDFTAIESLLEEGIDINSTDRYGWGVLHVACNCSNLNVYRLLINKNANVNGEDAHSKTPLHWACRNGILDVAELLLEHNVNINATDIYGDTPLHDASMNNHLDVVRMLVEKGADIGIKNRGNPKYSDRTPRTPEDYARLENHTTIVNYLVRQKQVVQRRKAYVWLWSTWRFTKITKISCRTNGKRKFSEK